MWGARKTFAGRIVSVALSGALLMGNLGSGIQFAVAEESAAPSIASPAATDASAATSASVAATAVSSESETASDPAAVVNQASRDEPPAATPVREALELETDATKVFEMSDGTLETHLFSAPMQVEASSGSFMPISTALVADSEAGSYRTLASPTTVTFAPVDAVGPTVRATRNGVSVTIDLAGSSAALPYVMGDRATYPAIAQGTTLLYEARSDGLKETAFLASPVAGHEVTFDMSVSGGDLVTLPGGALMIAASGESTATFSVGALSVVDAAGVECTGTTTAIARSGEGRYRFTYSVDPGWLHAPERAFPVAVDPSLLVDQDTFVSESANNSYVTDPDLEMGRANGASNDDRRSYIRFDTDSAGLAGRYVHDATYQAYLNYIQCSSRTYLAKTTEYWNPGDLKWLDDSGKNNGVPTYTLLTSQLVASVGWTYWDVGNLVQEWVRPLSPLSWGGYTLQMYQAEDGTQGSNHYKRFYSENTATSYKPFIQVHSEAPSVSAGPASESYSLSGSDVVTVTAQVTSAWLSDVRNLSVRINGADGGTRARGEMRWYSYAPSESGIATSAAQGGGYFAYVTSDTAQVEPLIERWTYSDTGTTRTYVLAFRVGSNYGDVQDNSLDTRLVMGQGSDTFDTGWKAGVAEFNVVPVPVADEATITASGHEWFTSSYGNPALSPNDTDREGRGAVALGWAQAPGADGYRIWAHDGNTWRQMGAVDGGLTTTWTSEGAGLFPKDTAIAGLPASSPVDGFRGTAPSLASRISTLAAGGRSSAPIVVSDGTYLYSRSQVATSWLRIGRGLKYTQAGVATGSVGTTCAPAKSAFHLEGWLYSGSTATTNNDTLRGVWRNASQGSNASETVIDLGTPLLSASTGADAATGSPDVLVASDGEFIYSVSQTRGSGFNGWKVRKYHRTPGQNEATLVASPEIDLPSYETASVIAQPGFLTFVESTTTASARVTRVRTSDYSLVNRWTLGLADAGSGAYDDANDSIWIGSKSSGQIWRTTAPPGSNSRTTRVGSTPRPPGPVTTGARTTSSP